MEKTLRFNSVVTQIEKVNPLFSKVKIYVMYEGFNQNGSYIHRDAINKALSSIYNIPIVGEYLKEFDNFGDHANQLVEDGEGNLKLVQNTRPYGVVPESAQIYWETVTEEDGTQRDYLVVDGAYLWTGRYPELNTVLEEKQFGQSMEIRTINAKHMYKDGREVYAIQDFVFSAFCILGISKDTDPYGHVEPAFESAKIVAYTLDKESFKQQFSQMIEELKFTLEKGGQQKMEDNKVTEEFSDFQDELKKKTQTSPTTVIEEDETQIDPTPETAPEGSEPSGEPTSEEGEPTTQPEDESTPEGSEGSTEGDGDGVEGTTDSGSTDGGTTFQAEYEELKTQFEALKSEIAELRKYKRTREEDDIRQKFSTQVAEEEMNEIFASNKDASIESIESQIFALIGKKNFSLNDKEKPKQNKVPIVSPKESEENPYGDILN